MSPRTVHFYIYYRIAAAQEPIARVAIETLVQALSQQFGVNGRLLRAQNDPALWMEIYENVTDPERFEAEMTLALAQSGLASCLAPGSTRRIERFVEQNAGQSGRRAAPRA